MCIWRRIFVATLSTLAGLSAGHGYAQGLQMGMDGVGWENNTATGPLLTRTVNEADLVSVTAKISAQTAGTWSQAGIIARVPNPTAGENYQAVWSFRAPGVNPPWELNTNNVTGGFENELDTMGLTGANLTYLRLDRVGAGQFQTYYGTGPDDAHITWTPRVDAMMLPQTQTNANMAGVPLQVGLAAGAIGALPGASVVYDWVQIQTTTQTYRDDFNYTRDLSTQGLLGFDPNATSGGTIWDNVLNPGAGGVGAQAGANLARCVSCTWNVNGSGNFSLAPNWGQANLFAPNQNDNTVLFGSVLTAASATVFNNSDVALKEIDFDNANKYVLAGPGTVTLDASSGNSLIHVISGSHEIQTKLSLNKNVTATAEAGATLNVNAQVFLNGHTFTVAGAGTINLNDGTVAVGSGAGSGALVNEGNLGGLGGVIGDLTQTSAGSLAVQVGDSPIDVQGAAALSGTLDVSLTAGFVPQLGHSYTVLTADSITNSGLSLSGPAAGLFRLVVGPGNVSLVATAIPEPSTLLLAALGLAVGGCVRLRQRFFGMRSEEFVKLHCCFFTLACLVLVVGSAAQASTLTAVGGVPTTYTDEFDSFFNYESAGGAAPANTLAITGGGTASWTGTYNQQNGGGDFNGSPYHAVFQANGNDFNGSPTPGQLGIEDVILHQNIGGTTGVGWGDGNKNSAPMLYANVDAGNDFDATIKITTQTAGQWSYAPIVARIHGPSVGHGGDATDPLDLTERFVTAGGFRTDPANPNNSTLLIQADGLNAAGTAIGEMEAQSAVVTGSALPLWVRMSKSGGQFTTTASIDGINFTNPTVEILSDLGAPGTLLDVGPSFMMYPTSTTPGFLTIDSFAITVKPGGRQTDNYWNPTDTATASGDWNNVNNWGSDSKPGTAPNVNSTDVTIGAIGVHPNPNATSGPATVYNNTAGVTVRSVTFNSPNKYTISGAGSLTLDPDAQSLIDTTATYIHLAAGSHEIQVPLGLSAAAAGANTITADASTRLDINNSLDLNGKRLTIKGSGKVNINSNIDLATVGAVLVSGGNLGGSGRINGALLNGDGTVTNPAGTVSPGNGLGTLTVDNIGTGAASTGLQQFAGGKINIELGGTAAGLFDVISVLGGTVKLTAGSIDVSLVNGFNPAVNNTWEIVKSVGALSITGLTLDPSDSPFYTLTKTTDGALNVVVLKLVTAIPPPGVQGDYNGNGIVDAADYSVWRDHLGQTFALPNRSTANTGAIGQADYDFWKSRFGATSGSGSASSSSGAVPEPSSWKLLWIAATIVLAARRAKGGG